MLLSELKAALLHLSLGGDDMWRNGPWMRHPMALSLDIISRQRPTDAVKPEMMSSNVGRPAAALARLEWLNKHHPVG